MALTCACGKCDTSKIIGGAEQLEQIIECVQSEERKSRDMVWRSRIQKRIDELSKEVDNLNSIPHHQIDCDIVQEIRYKNVRKNELEDLLKEVEEK